MKQYIWHCVILMAVCLAAETTATYPQSSLRKLQAQVPIGFQSGPDPGATFGGTITYSPDSGRIYVTGSSYGNFFKNANEGSANSGKAANTPSCFLGIADLPPANDVGTGSVAWLHAHQWETRVPEACNVIHVDDNPENLPENNTSIEEKVYLLGYTSTNGLMDPLRLESTFPAAQYGMIMDIDIVSTPDTANPFTTTFWGGRLLQDGPVQYPIDMALDEDGNIYLASLQSYNPNPSVGTRPDQVAKQMSDPSAQPYGSDYNMLVEQFLYDNPGYDDGIGLPADPLNVPIDTTIVDNWRKPFSPTSESSGAIVSGIEYLGGLLILVGSTNGHGLVFGNDVQTNSNHTDTSMNGFITKIMPDSGKYIPFVADNGASKDSDAAQPAHKRSSTSILSMNFKDDYIMGMCSSPADPDNFYIVGTTEGQIDKQLVELVEGEVHAFLVKINVWTLLPQWVKQIGGNPLNKDVVRGMTCAVTDDGKDVYMAGIVANGGALSLYNQESHGKDDVFLFQARADDGRLQFLRQIGTSGSDRISPGGLTTDEFGNAILMGNTDGSFYRSRKFDQESEKSEDIFIMTVMRGTGDYKESEVESDQQNSPAAMEADDTEAPITATEDETQEKPHDEEEEVSVEAQTQTQAMEESEPDVTEPIDPFPSEPSNGEPEDDNSSEEEAAVTTNDNEPEIYTVDAGVSDEAWANHEKKKNNLQPHQEDDTRYGLFIFFVLIAVIMGFVAGLFVYSRIAVRAEAKTDRNGVLGYLNDFDVDDIDLKQSATGGYHCSYTNDLAHGINARAASQEGLFSASERSSKSVSSHQDPLLALHHPGGDPRAGGEIHFSDEPSDTDRDDMSSIGSGIGAKGRHSTHVEPLIDAYDREEAKRHFMNL